MFLLCSTIYIQFLIVELIISNYYSIIYICIMEHSRYKFSEDVVAMVRNGAKTYPKAC